MTDVILQPRRHRSTSISATAIVAFWNAPLDVPDHTRRAVEATLAMRDALARFNREQAVRAHAGQKVVCDIRMGVGLNTGLCSVGNMGSIQRFDYSALGDPMNLAARLEALTKTYGVDALATSAIVERTRGFAWIEIDEVKVKGRSSPTRLFALFGDEAVAATDAFQDWAGQHARMREASRSGHSAEAAVAARLMAGVAEPHWRPLYENLAGRYAEAEKHETGPVDVEVVEPADVAHMKDAV